MRGIYPKGSLKESAVLKPTMTVMFGEKKNQAQRTPENPQGAMDYFMDMFEPNGSLPTGNDTDRIEHGCHGVTRKISGAGGSNYAFVDGSVRYMRYGATTWPLNLWAVSDDDRLVNAFQAP